MNTLPGGAVVGVKTPLVQADILQDGNRTHRMELCSLTLGALSGRARIVFRTACEASVSAMSGFFSVRVLFNGAHVISLFQDASVVRSNPCRASECPMAADDLLDPESTSVCGLEASAMHRTLAVDCKVFFVEKAGAGAARCYFCVSMEKDVFLDLTKTH